MSTDRDAIRQRVWAAIDARQSAIRVDPPPFEAILDRAQGRPPTPPSGPPLSLPTLGPGAAGPGSGAASVPAAASPAPVAAGTATAGPTSASGGGTSLVGKLVRVGVAVSIAAAATAVGLFFRDEIRCAFAAEEEIAVDDCDPSTETTLRAAAEELIASLRTGDARDGSPHIPQRCSRSDVDAGVAAVEGSDVRIETVDVIGRGGEVDVSFVSGDRRRTESIPWLYVDGRWVIGVCGALDFGG